MQEKIEKVILSKKRESHLDWKEGIGFLGGLLTTLGMIPQVMRLFKLKSAYDISLTYSICLTIGIACWLAYGMMNGLISVIIWNGLALILGCGILYAKIKWGR